MLFDFKKLPPRERYKLLVSTVTPRPIAWIVSQNVQGHLNAAPFSFFNAFAGDPPVVGIGIGSHEPGRAKDTRANICETRQFVVNLVSQEIAERMNITAIEFPPGIDELKQAGLSSRNSGTLQPPRWRGYLNGAFGALSRWKPQVKTVWCAAPGNTHQDRRASGVSDFQVAPASCRFKTLTSWKLILP